MAMRLLHVGFAVRDLEMTTAVWRTLFGIDWEPPVRHDLPDPDSGPDHVSLVTHGRTGDGVELEMVQTVSGPTIDAQVFGDREGMSHLAFQVDDLDAERARMIAAGVEVLGEGSAPRADWVFLRDARLGGLLVQLVQLHRD